MIPLGGAAAGPGWGSLGRDGPWREYVQQARAAATALERFAPDVVIAVDWHGAEAAAAAAGARGASPRVLLSYRVFSRADSASDADFYRDRERRAVSDADVTVALGKADAGALTALGATRAEVLILNHHPASLPSSSTHSLAQ